jgi:hypothetical protein
MSAFVRKKRPEAFDVGVLRLVNFFSPALCGGTAAAKRFRGMQCTTNNPHGCDPQGSDRFDLQWDGKQLIVDIHYDNDGKKMSGTNASSTSPPQPLPKPPIPAKQPPPSNASSPSTLQKSPRIRINRPVNCHGGIIRRDH